MYTLQKNIFYRIFDGDQTPSIDLLYNPHGPNQKHLELLKMNALIANHKLHGLQVPNRPGIMYLSSGNNTDCSTMQPVI